MRKIILASLHLCFLALVLASCGEWDNDWQAGPETKAGCQQVHFASGNDLNAILFPGENAVTLTAERNTDKGSLTVPLTLVSATEGLTVPTDLTFADGSTTATVTLTAPATATAGSAFAYTLQIGGDDVDPYADTENGATLSGNIFYPTLRRAKAWITEYQEKLGTWALDIYDLGLGKYMIRDFMSSGLDLMISRDANEDLSFSSPQWIKDNIDPDVTYTSCTYYYFYDYAGGYWNYFYPHGYEAWQYITWLELYGGDGYAIYDAEDDGFSISCMAGLNKGGDSNWHYLNIQFLKDGEQFTPYLPAEPQEPTGTPVTFTAWLDQQYDTFGGSWTMEATQTGDYEFTFDNFLLSGETVTMTADPATGAVTLSSTTSSYEYDGCFYITDASGSYAACYPNWQEGVQENYLNAFYIYNDPQYTYWMEEDKTFYLGSYMWVNEDYDNIVWDYLNLQLNGSQGAKPRLGKALRTPPPGKAKRSLPPRRLRR